MNRTKEEVLARMHQIIPHQEWLDLSYARGQGYNSYPTAFAEGQPFISRDIQGFFPMSRLRVAEIKEWLDLCLELYPPEEKIAHVNYRYCGDETCAHCYERERSRRPAGGHLRQKPKAGFVVLFKLRGAYGLFASSQPEKRLRAIQREWSESLQIVHRIETNDQSHLKELWEWNFTDFAIKDANLFFFLNDRALNTFQGCQYQDIDRNKTWEENMAVVDLYDITQLPNLVVSNRQVDQPSQKVQEFWDFLRQNGMKL